MSPDEPPRRAPAARRFVSFVVMLAGAGAAAGETAAPGRPSGPTARAVRAAGPIQIDGVLDEADWERGEPLSSFTQRLPAEGRPATQPTRVVILYDDERLFIGARLFDQEPERLIARELKEDGDLDHDDAFGVLLDTFHDRRNAYFFETNPNGARSDALIYDEGRTESFDWDGVWRVASRVDDEGWTVEMEIPFRTLHFDPERTNPWGLQIRRLIRRNTEDVFWAPVPRNESLFRVSRAGELHGLHGIRQGSSLMVKPYALGSVARRPTLGETAADGSGDIGLDARYDVTPNLAAVLTLNTDFAETEVDDEQVNITRFPLFFPEKREFFLESTGFFEFGFNRTGPGAPPGVIPFFSRRVGLDADNRPVPLQGGVKLVGRMGRYNVGFLSVNADGGADTPQINTTALRVSRDFLSRSNWGVVGVSREPAGPDRTGDPNDAADDFHSNRTWGADLNFSVLENFKFGGSLLQSVTPGGADSERAGHAYAYWSNNSWQMELSYRDIDEQFNPEAGFVQRTGVEEVEPFLGWSWRSDTARVRRIEPHARMRYVMDQDHDLATRWQHWGFALELRSGGHIEVAWNPQFESLSETFVLADEDGDESTRIDNVEVRPGGYDIDEWTLSYSGDPGRLFSWDGFLTVGDFFDGDVVSGEVELNARFSKHLRTELSVEQTRIDLPARPRLDPLDPASGAPASSLDFTLIQARLGVRFNTHIFFDTFLQHNSAQDDFSSNLRFNYKYRPGSDIYVVYNERRDIEGLPTDVVDRSFTVKWTYLMAF